MKAEDGNIELLLIWWDPFTYERTLTRVDPRISDKQQDLMRNWINVSADRKTFIIERPEDGSLHLWDIVTQTEFAHTPALCDTCERVRPATWLSNGMLLDYIDTGEGAIWQFFDPATGDLIWTSKYVDKLYPDRDIVLAMVNSKDVGPQYVIKSLTYRTGFIHHTRYGFPDVE